MTYRTVMPSKSNTWLIAALLIAVIGWRLQAFGGVAMATQDQIEFSTALGQEHGLWREVLGHAQGQGRLYFLLTKFIDLLSAAYATRPLAQIANLALFAGAPALIAWMVFRDGRDQVLFLLAYWALCTLGWYHTTPAAYPLVLTVPVVLAGAAAAMARSHSNRPTRRKLIAYGALAFAAFFQYEPATLIATVLLVWFIRTRVADGRRRRQLYIATAVPLGLYAVAYLAWRTIYPSQYDANVAFGLSPVAIVRVLVVYALGALPLPPHAMPNVSVGDMTIGEQVLPYPRFGIRSAVSELEWMDMVIAIAASGLLWSMLAARNVPARDVPQGSPTLGNVSALGLVLLLAANVLVAVSRKYQLWAEGSPAPYLTSYYALFGWVVLATGASRLLSPGWARAGAVTAFAVVFLYSSASNHFAGKQIRANFSKWQAVDALGACQDQLAAYDTFVLPAAYYGVSGNRGDWSGYWHDWTRSALGSPLRIAPYAPANAAARSAYAQPLLDDRGALKAVVGHGMAGGFLIYRRDRPNYVWLRQASAPAGTDAGELVVVEGAATSRCRRGYHVIELTGSRPIESIDVYWHLPGTPVRSDSLGVFPLSTVGDADLARVVQGLYLGFLRRAADPGGLQFWSDRIRRSDGRTFDVVGSFSGWPEWTESMRRKPNFDDLVVDSFQVLLGREPRSDEIQRLSRFRIDARYRALVPWLVFADLLESNDAALLNRLQLAQDYTENVYPRLGWRADVWERSASLIGDDPESLQRGIASLRN